MAAIVSECTDDKSLPKWQRKKYQVMIMCTSSTHCTVVVQVYVSGNPLQIEAASRKSYKAKLVSLGDKLFNLQDLDSSPPPTWNRDRIQLYFSWSAQVGSHTPQLPQGMCYIHVTAAQCSGAIVR